MKSDIGVLTRVYLIVIVFASIVIYGNTARASSEESIRVTTRFYFVQAYDSERNLIEGALV